LGFSGQIRHDANVAIMPNWSTRQNQRLSEQPIA
jgi:hypothetical protein